MIKKHFYLMSVLRNLVNNSIDACEGHGRIDVTAIKDGEDVLIQVKDNGSGIEEDDATYIFNTGFSNKFNEETGDISRGIGLTLVKEMVENVFGGTIDFESTYGQGTVFKVRLKEALLEEGDEHEMLSVR